MELVYGVMVTQLFLVQSFKVRVLVDQQKTPQEIGEFFYFGTSIPLKNSSKLTLSNLQIFINVFNSKLAPVSNRQ